MLVKRGLEFRLGITTSAITLACLPTMASTALAQAQPSGLNVVTGDISVEQVSPTRLDVVQKTQFGVANWDYLGNAQGHHTHFQLPGSDAVHVSRQVGAGASFFDGRVTSNGRLFLLNRSGVYFGQNARVDAAGLVASTSDIDPTKTISGGAVNLVRPGHAGARVVNNGIIAADAVALLGRDVENGPTGKIVANLGRVTLAAGEAFTVDFDGDDFVRFTTPESPVVQRALKVANKGLIQADGGAVTLAADTARAVLDNLINTEGVIQARSMVKRGGKILLLGGDTTTTRINGTLDASASEPGAKGGTVVALGKTLLLGDAANLDVSGAAGGGVIRVGGDVQGQGDLHRAAVSYVAAGARLNADATDNGDAGSIVVWADGLTMFLGEASAQGGPNGGDGGFVEVSGKQDLVMHGEVHTLAPHGENGTLLLDPDYLVITGDGIAELVGTPTFTPADPLGTPEGADPILWFTPANVDTPTDGSPVATWTNAGSDGGSATGGGSPPTYSDNAINTSPGVVFDGTNDSMTFNALGTLNGAQTERTATMVVRTGSDVLGTELIYEDGGSGNGFSIYVHQSEIYFNLYNSGGTQRTFFNDAVTPNTVYQYTMVYNGPAGTMNAYRTGTQILADPPGVTPRTGTFPASLSAHGNANGLGAINSSTIIESATSGTNLGTSGTFEGTIGEVVIFDNALSDEARGVVDQETAGRFGITLTEALSNYNTVSQVYLEHLATQGNVSVQATNDITIRDLDGGVLDLGANGLTMTAGGVIDIATASTIRTTAGAVVFDGNTTLSADLTLDTGTGSTTFNGTLNGANMLNVTSGGVTFSGAVGDTTPVASVAVTNATDILFNDAATVGTFTQTAGTGTTNFGATGLTATGAVSLATDAALGEITAPSLNLVTNSADLTGSIAGATDAAAAVPITGGPFGDHFMNGCFINSGACPTTETIGTSLDIARLSFAPTYDGSAEGGQYDMGKRSNARGYLQTAMVAICSAQTGDVESCLGELSAFADQPGALAESSPFDALRYLDLYRDSLATTPTPRGIRDQAAHR